MWCKFKPPVVEIPELQVKNTNEGRWYVTPSGLYYPSITHVLGSKKSDVLEKWRQRVGAEFADKESARAVSRGNSFHEMVERFIKGEIPEDFISEYPSVARRLFNSIRLKLKMNLSEVHIQEKALYSDILKVAGRVDCIGEYNGKLSVIDFKGSNKAKKEEWIENYFNQATFYALSYWERTKIYLPKQIVIMIMSEDSAAQVFVRNTSDYVDSLRKVVDDYYETVTL